MRKNILSKELILNLSKQIDINECWLRPVHTRPVIWISGRKFFLAKIVAHLWHGLDLEDEDKLGCHKCNNENCFNPEHIYSGTYSSNAIDMVIAGTHGQVKRKFCKLGHLLDGIKIRRNGLKERYCKTCQRIANIKYRGY